ncbi:hypothetical protein CGRA01v4_13539 [Colletotrichum graminicola]|nr:hypothetical protein CGRA01v4_13539 [Colletotrichum graminicola]
MPNEPNPTQTQHNSPKHISPFSGIPRQVARNRSKRRGRKKGETRHSTAQHSTAQGLCGFLGHQSAVSGSTRSNLLCVPFACSRQRRNLESETRNPSRPASRIVQLGRRGFLCFQPTPTSHTTSGHFSLVCSSVLGFGCSSVCPLALFIPRKDSRGRSKNRPQFFCFSSFLF